MNLVEVGADDGGGHRAADIGVVEMPRARAVQVSVMQSAFNKRPKSIFGSKWWLEAVDTLLLSGECLVPARCRIVFQFVRHGVPRGGDVVLIAKGGWLGVEPSEEFLQKSAVELQEVQTLVGGGACARSANGVHVPRHVFVN